MTGLLAEVRMLTAAGNLPQAVAELEKLAKNTSDPTRALMLLGTARNQMKDYEKAISDANQAIRYQPDYIYSYFTRGIAYYEKGDHKKARADFEQILKMTKAPNLRKSAEDYLKKLAKGRWPFG